MAKLDGVIQFTGKLGQTVGVKGQDGRNVLRVRRNSIKNPKTDAQCAQRMICTTAAQAVSQLKQILNNSFEGKSFGAKSLQYARSLYMRMLRTTPSLDGNGMVYLPKGSLNFPVNAYPLSQGSLRSTGGSYDAQAGSSIVFLPAAFTGVPTASQLFPQVEVGNQITILAVGQDQSLRNKVSICRFAFKDDKTPALVSIGEGEFKINPEAINANLAEGDFGKIVITEESGRFSFNVSEMLAAETIIAAATIVSDKINGKRSTDFLEFSADILSTENRGGLSAAEAMPTYGDNAASLNLVSDYYLQNSLTPEAGE